MQGGLQKRIYTLVYLYEARIHGGEPSIPTRFPECPALTSSNNNNNKKGWRPRFNQRVCLPDVINSKSPGKTSGKRDRERVNGRAKRMVEEKGEGERRGMAAVIFGVYHITEPMRGLISSPLARQDGVKSWISRPICTFLPLLLSSASFLFSFSFFFLALFAHYSTVGA